MDEFSGTIKSSTSSLILVPERKNQKVGMTYQTDKLYANFWANFWANFLYTKLYMQNYKPVHIQNCMHRCKGEVVSESIFNLVPFSINEPNKCTSTFT